jgi:hypothetical protein
MFILAIGRISRVETEQRAVERYGGTQFGGVESQEGLKPVTTT